MHAPPDPDIQTKRRPPFGEFVALVAFMMGLTAFAVDNVLPAFPALGRTFAVSDPNRLQLLVYVYMIGFGATHLVYGPASDIFGRRPAFLAGLAVFLLGCVAAMFAPDFETLLAARCLQGCGAAAGRVVAVAIVRDRFVGREMARVMSLTMMVFITVPIFAPAIGGLLLLVGDWHAIFASMLVLGVLLGIWFVRRMPETLRAENRQSFSVGGIAAAFGQTATCRPALGYATAFGLMFGSIMSYVGSAQQIFAEDVYGLGPYFPVAFGLIAITMGFASLLNSRLVRRYGMHRISHIGMLCFVGLSVLQCGFAFLFAGRPPLLLFGGILALSQFVTSLTMPNFNALAMEPLGRIAGTASSLIGFYTTFLGAMCGAFVGQHYDGTVIPLALGYASLSLTVVAVVLVTERGRLFRPTHVEPLR
ncbi:multidrug effflux MFS transporter [Enterovirga aerilata]|uniref:Bcr/CflA family efflux transporter n=1 Tax=Enterovirga aerilata TaxID=2730920 RepID=A0A849I3I1_9HYPH|nr:multidrug effflux MFS transporter [Enterovirga sp. DB1703]NNM71918.1 multidrug effflux MFS transporter [Enterovirga sp. DB1703]